MTFCKKISCEKKNINNKYLVDIDDVMVCEESNVDKYLITEEKKEYINDIKLGLEFIDSCIFELRYNGFSYKEISILLDLPLRSVQFRGRKAKKICSSHYVM